MSARWSRFRSANSSWGNPVDWQIPIVVAAILLALGYVVRGWIRTVAGSGSGCGSGCSKCASPKEESSTPGRVALPVLPEARR
jgi:FeoB-associated Cys-rich membrane protein